MIIFFTENITPFTASNGMRVHPSPCKLIDGRDGFFSTKHWESELNSKGAITEEITKEEIVVEAMPIVNEEL